MSGTKMPGSRYVEVEPGVRVYVEDTGVGKPIVFIHGWLADHRVFEYQFNEFPHHGYRCVGIDLRGYGKSDKPYGEYNYDIFADDINAVLEALDLQSITLVGFSLGGAVTMRYISRHAGHRVAKLALVGAAAPVFTQRDDFPYGWEKAGMDGFIEACLTDRPEVIAQSVKLIFHRQDSVGPKFDSVGREFAEWLRSLAMEASAYAMVSGLALMRDADLRPDLVGIKVPTAIFHAVEDSIAPFALAEQLLTGIAGSTLIRFEKSGHMLFYQERQKFNQELMRFIG